jgi:hypothetical protein
MDRLRAESAASQLAWNLSNAKARDLNSQLARLVDSHTEMMVALRAAENDALWANKKLESLQARQSQARHAGHALHATGTFLGVVLVDLHAETLVADLTRLDLT